MSTSIVIISSNAGTISALHANSGKTIWRTDIRRPLAPRSLAYDAQTLLAATLDGHLLALNPRTGALIWQQAIPLPPPYTGNVVHVVKIKANDGLCAVSFERIPNLVSVHRVRDGALLWRHHPAQTLISSLHTVNRERIIITDFQSLRGSGPRFALSAFASADGTPLWARTDPFAFFMVDSVVEHAEVVYGCGKGRFALAAASGAVLWHVEQDAFWPHRSLIQLAVAQDRIYLTAQNLLGAYDARTGDRIWAVYGAWDAEPAGTFGERFEHFALDHDTLTVMKARLNDPHCVANNVSASCELRDLHTGAILSHWPTQRCLLNPNITTQFLASDGAIFVPTFDRLYAIDLHNRQQRWQRKLNLGKSSLIAVTLP